MRLLLLVDVPGQRHDHIVVGFDFVHRHVGAFPRPYLAGEHRQPSVVEMDGAFRCTGGENQDIVVRLHIHRLFKIPHGAGADLIYIAEELLIAGKVIAGAGIIIPGLVALALVHHRDGEHLVLGLLEHRVHGDERGAAHIGKAADKFVQPREHVPGGHVVPINNQGLVMILRGFDGVAHIEEKAAVFRLILMKIVLEIVGVVDAPDNGQIDLQEIVGLVGFIGDKAPQVGVFGIQQLEGIVHAGEKIEILQLFRQGDGGIGVVFVPRLSVQIPGRGGKDDHIVGKIGQGAHQGQQRQDEHALAHDLQRPVPHVRNDHLHHGQQHLPHRPPLTRPAGGRILLHRHHQGEFFRL